MSHKPTASPSLEELHRAAARAQAAYRWAEAVALYTQALERVDTARQGAAAAETRYDLLEGRAECHRHLDDLAARDADLAAMTHLAEELDDGPRTVRALTHTVGLRIDQGQLAEARQAAERALALAMDEGDPALEAEGLASLCEICQRLGDWASAQEAQERALHRYRELGDEAGEALVLYLRGRGWRFYQERDLARADLERALAHFRRLGDREREALALNALGILAGDGAVQRAYYEQALALADLTGDTPLQFRLYNNLGLVYWRLGLYRRARDYIGRAVGLAQESQAAYNLAYGLESLGRPYLALGEVERAQALFEEGMGLGQASGDRNVVLGYWLALGHVALARGRPAEAGDPFRRAGELAAEIEASGDQATALAWLGAAHLALGQVREAQACTAQAATLLEAAPEGGEFPPQEVWWWRYRALTAHAVGAQPPPKAHGDLRHAAPLRDDAAPVSDAAWHALDRAREAMLAGIATLSDEGLRRSYFSRVEINRQIVQAWLRQAAARELPLEPLTDALVGESDLQGQLQRMLEIGVRLNARREGRDLPQFIMDEVVELTGAQRAVLFLLDAQGERQVAAEASPPFTADEGPPPTDAAAWLDEITPLLEEVTQKRAPLLRYLPAGVPELEQRSVLCVPLVAQGTLVGLVVADLPGVCGRFSERDRDLLAVLANQAAVAVENARWTNTLEQRVEERTAELEAANKDLRQRNAELAVINSVQQGLAAQLDMQAIYDLVGDKVRDIFDAQVVVLSTYDHTLRLVRERYAFEGGEKPPLMEARPFNRLAEHLIATRQPVLINENVAQHSAEFGLTAVPGTDMPKSYLAVPLVAGTQVQGIISLQNLDREHAFTESDVRLLTTLANSMSVALENARLFAETQRLLAETEQRAAELAVINSVQQGLARQLDFQAIIDLVGDTLREVFGGVMTFIALYDEASNHIAFPYWVGDEGERIETPSVELGQGLTSVVIQTRQPLVLGTLQEMQDLGAIDVTPEDPRQMESWMGVPILIGERVIGVVAMQDWPPHRYTDSDVRLLSTITASMGVALENARLFAETQRLLEETQQRNAELAVINSVQQGLVAEMDIQAIYDLVGDQIRDTFDAQSVLLATYDHGAERVTNHYVFEKGKRFYPPPSPFNDLHRHLIRSGEAVRIDEESERAMAAFGMRITPGTEMPLSALFVPLVAGGQVKGFVSLQNIDHEHAFDDADQRLLSTLAASMSVALENARLFGETTRLLEETEQRNAELAILNSVGEAMSKELDVSTIGRLVGDKVRSIFAAQVTTIGLYEPEAEVVHWLYQYDRGYVDDAAPLPFGQGLTSQIITSRQPRVFGTAQAGEAQGGVFGPDAEGGEGRTESYMGVPILAGERVLGVVSVQSYRQHAYDAASVRLLSTLAASMGVALENARLFEETTRLLAETEQRAAELAVINSVQQGLAQQLDFQAIIDLVGDTLRDVFAGVSTFIALYDEASNQIEVPYWVGDEGERIEAPPMELGPGLTSVVIQTRQPLVLGTMEEALAQGAIIVDPEDPRKKESWMGVPVLVGERVIGVVAMQDYPQHRYTDSDVRLLRTITASMGVALENARLFEETTRLLDETQQRNTELALINKVQHGLVQQLDVQGIVELVGDQIRESLGGPSCFIAFYDRETNRIEFPYWVGDQGQRIEAEPMELGEGLTSVVLQRRQPLALGTLEEAAELGALTVDDGTGRPKEKESWMGVPILAGDEAIGVITLQDWPQHRYDQADVRLLSTVAASMGVALENARLFEETAHLLDETQQRAAEMATVNRISHALASELDLEALIRLAGEQLRQTFDADIVYVALLDPQTNLIHFPYQHGEALRPLPLGTGLTSRIIQTGEPLLINQDSASRTAELGVERVGIPAQSYLGVPIPVSGKSIGVISVQSTRQEGRFDEDDVRLLGTIAATVGSAIHNAQLYRETQRRAAEMATLAEVGRDVAVTLDPTVVLERIAAHALELLDAASSAVFLLQPDGQTLRAIAALGEYGDPLLGLELQMGQGIVGTIVQTGTAERIDDASQDPRAAHIPGTDEEEASEKLMVSPLLLQDQAIGALAVWREPHDGAFSTVDLDFLVGLAQQAAITIENARLFAEVESQQRYSASIVQSSPVAIITVDGSGQVQSWNPAAERLFGYTEAEALGRELDALITTPEIREEAARYTRQAVGGQRIHAVTRRCRRDGTMVDVEVSAMPVSEDGRERMVIATYHDISELKRAEQALLEAKAAAEAANRAKSAFLATMSHEIRTPLNAVIGMTGLLLDTDLDAEQHDFAETVRTSGDALLAIINDILDFSKIEAERIELEHRPLGLREFVEGTLDLVAPKAAEKGLELGCLIDDQVPAAIAADETRLRQILLNLLSNAVKFTDEGEIVVSVEPGDAVPGPGTALHFSVRDTGLGIPPDRMNQLFQSFSQVDSSTTRKYGGTGLGLAISKRLSELMGGSMWVESEGVPGRGSTFHFTIQAAEAPAPERAYLKPTQLDLQGKRVLIVDDNATNRRILTLQTQGWGMRPQATDSPTEAVDWVRRGELFDVALLDRQMPEVDGPMLAAEIHALRPDLPLVMVSSLGEREKDVGGVEITAWLVKPIKASQLYDVLAGILARETPPAKEEEAAAKPAFDREMGARLPLRILLAEDNAVNQKLALHVLERLGYRADVAANGRDAVDALRQQPYDVVLMDVQMPEMDGLEATRAIRQELPLDRQPRIIAVTANVMQEDQEACLAAGMDDYIGKPFRVQDLRRALSKCQVLE